jgi:hypothetical protein
MKRDQIKNLQSALPRGAPFDTARLRDLGISAALAHRYVKSGWLEKLGRGVFMFTGDTLTRDGTVRFLETRVPGLHVAAKTALAWHGFRHNVAHEESLILWGDRRGGLPAWFSGRFPARYSTSRLFGEDLPSGYGISPLPESPHGPPISEPERALLEMLSEVGVHQEVDEARNIMEGVRQIRTRHLKVLLEACRMVKAVRLCVIWSEELGLPWASHAREAAKGRMGAGRWVARLKDGSTLILKPQ